MGKLLYLPGDQKQPSGNQLVTLDDLEKFRINLLMDIRKMLEGKPTVNYHGKADYLLTP